MGLELVSGYSRRTNKEDEQDASMMKRSESNDRSAELVTNTILMTKTDLILNRLNDIEREMDQVKNTVNNETTKLAFMNKDLTRVVATSGKQILNTSEESFRNMDASMDRLANKKLVKSVRKLALVTMTLSIINVVAIVILALYTFGYFQ